MINICLFKKLIKNNKIIVINEIKLYNKVNVK